MSNGEMVDYSDDLSWGERLAIINNLKPSTEAICAVLRVTLTELQVAYMLQDVGTLSPTSCNNMDKYENLFKKYDAKPNEFSIIQSNRAIISTLNSRNKIQNAFKAVPSYPTPIKEFAKEHGISVSVLRQSKRFNTLNQETIIVKQDSVTKELMIWKK